MKIITQECILFFRFLCRPTFIRKSSNKFEILKLISLFLVLLPICYLLVLVTELPFIKSYFCNGTDSTIEQIFKLGPLPALLLVSVVAPILEEYYYRFYLDKIVGNLVLMFINIITLAYIFFSITTTLLTTYIFITLIIIFTLQKLLIKKYAFRRNILLFFKKYFFIFFYLSALTFGLLHVNNYQICNKHSVLIIFLVLPQLFSGLVFGYARLKYGIWTSILLHFAINFIGVGLLFLTK